MMACFKGFEKLLFVFKYHDLMTSFINVPIVVFLLYLKIQFPLLASKGRQCDIIEIFYRFKPTSLFLSSPKSGLILDGNVVVVAFFFKWKQSH